MIFRFLALLTGADPLCRQQYGDMAGPGAAQPMADDSNKAPADAAPAVGPDGELPIDERRSPSTGALRDEAEYQSPKKSTILPPPVQVN